jgi:hypothetical protein
LPLEKDEHVEQVIFRCSSKVTHLEDVWLQDARPNEHSVITG